MGGTRRRRPRSRVALASVGDAAAHLRDGPSPRRRRRSEPAHRAVLADVRRVIDHLRVMATELGSVLLQLGTMVGARHYDESEYPPEQAALRRDSAEALREAQSKAADLANCLVQASRSADEAVSQWFADNDPQEGSAIRGSRRCGEFGRRRDRSRDA